VYYVVNTTDSFLRDSLKNKQYLKEEYYEELIIKIKSYMNTKPYKDKTGIIYKYGEFFPIELSPFGYNETVANEYFPMTKEEIQAKGYKYTDIKKYKGEYKVTMRTQDIPDHIKNVGNKILEEVIECANVHNEEEKKDVCKGVGAFKIIPQELEFYKKQNFPIPRLCPDCRHFERIKQRNPLKLWHRKCTCGGKKSDNNVYDNIVEHFHKAVHCPNEFETTYAPERKEIVYCEPCYLSEVV